jgi:hypothetical protein
VKFHQPGPSSLSTLDLNANVCAKTVEVIQAEIVGHGYLYFCAVFLTVHDKLTCEVCRGQLKALHTNTGNRDLLFLSE